ncbi:DUF3047 domain-containing protein [Ectothiorhodospiraceae bacterium WFHF3C12]|nr:DUF3047 domain-containing protein [Ectothiorhodospiraceae bacterium WFHF3C12]
MCSASASTSTSSRTSFADVSKRLARPRGACLVLGAVLALPANAQQARIFEPQAIVDWEAHAFEGRTEYRLGRKAGRPAVEAHCADGASGLFFRGEIDLEETPVIEWRWFVARPPDGPDETTRAGDDFAARLYAVDENSLLPWRTRALNYVWTRSRPVGTAWPNPFAEQARMIAVQAGPADGWVTERRNLRADFRRYHARDPQSLDAIAIMTDCDNTGVARRAWYGTIRLLPE